MQKRFKPLLAAAVAAGAIPLLDAVTEVHAAGITAAGFTFEAFPTGGNTQGSVSYAADTFALGYGGTLTATISNATAGGWGSTTGNGSARAISSNGWNQGGFYNFGFDIDDLDTLIVRFDTRSSASGPGTFLVEFSSNGVTFGTVGTVTVTTASFSTGTNTGTTIFNNSFSMPLSFSDPSPGVAGNTGIIRLVAGSLQANGSTFTGAGGTNSLDNVFITGQQIPEPTAMVMTLAAAATLSLRPKRRD